MAVNVTGVPLHIEAVAGLIVTARGGTVYIRTVSNRELAQLVRPLTLYRMEAGAPTAGVTVVVVHWVQLK